jgi:hypothetical protein
MKAATMLNDSLHIRMNDIGKVAALRSKLQFIQKNNDFATTKVVSENPAWFNNSDFMTDFNAMLKVLNSEAEFLVGVKEAPLDQLTRDGTGLKIGKNLVVVLDTIRRDNIPIVQHYYLDSVKATPYRLDDYVYDTRMIEFLASNAIDTLNLDTLLVPPSPPIFNRSLDSLRNSELKQLRDSTRKVQIENSKTEPLKRLRKRLIEITGTR